MDVKKFFEGKRTYRKFLQTPISDEVFDDIIEAARIYSSAANRQGLKFVAVRKPENVKELNSYVHYAGYLPKEVGTPKEDEIPVAFIVVLQDTTVCAANDTDAGLALGNITTAAWMHGIGSCIMGAIERGSIVDFLALPDNLIIHTVVALGYPKKESNVVDFAGDIKYFLDDNGDTCVPKRSRKEVIKFFD